VYKTVIKAFLLILTLQLFLQAEVIDIDNLVNKAKKSDKHLLVWLHKTDCGYCENMREFTLENETIKDFIDENFIFVHINVYEKGTVKYQNFSGNSLEFAKEIDFNFYPSSLFFDDEGDIIFAEVGFVDNKKMPNEKRFYKILNFIKSKSYEKSDFADYKFKINKEL